MNGFGTLDRFRRDVKKLMIELQRHGIAAAAESRSR